MSVVKFNFLSDALGMQANITVCLPTYSFSDRMKGKTGETYYVPGMKFQTLWLLHGGSGDDSDFVNFSNIARYADENKVAVVCPADYNAWYTNNPYGGARYFDYLVEELPRVCRSMFPLSENREDNFIGGLSMGMQGATKCAVLHPELYAVALFMSGTAMSSQRYVDRWEKYQKGIQVGGGGGAIFAAMGDPYKLAEGPDDTWFNAKKQSESGIEMPKMFFTAGSLDPACISTKETYEYFRELGFDCSFEEVEGYHHEWDFWDLSLKKALKEWFPLKHAPIYPTIETE